jgi:hypothetical protein
MNAFPHATSPFHLKEEFLWKQSGHALFPRASLNHLQEPDVLSSSREEAFLPPPQRELSAISTTTERERERERENGSTDVKKCDGMKCAKWHIPMLQLHQSFDSFELSDHGFLSSASQVHHSLIGCQIATQTSYHEKSKNVGDPIWHGIVIHPSVNESIMNCNEWMGKTMKHTLSVEIVLDSICTNNSLSVVTSKSLASRT